jgi:hypothetical protein
MRKQSRCARTIPRFRKFGPEEITLPLIPFYIHFALELLDYNVSDGDRRCVACCHCVISIAPLIAHALDRFLADGSLDERCEETRRGARLEKEPMKPRYFRDRSEAGRLLAAKLRNHADRSGVIVLALPRGGVPVAYEVAGAPRAAGCFSRAQAGRPRLRRTRDGSGSNRWCTCAQR